ncbi:MAG: redoxin domain-containing protein [Candidatus Azotimanducaceae bacterium WSBS_2022_MAG_OTU7]
MQLGELQSQLQRFANRGVKVVAISVDPPAHSRSMIRRMGLEFPIVSDERQEVQKAYRVQNPDTRRW